MKTVSKQTLATVAYNTAVLATEQADAIYEMPLYADVAEELWQLASVLDDNKNYEKKTVKDTIAKVKSILMSIK